MKPKDPANVVQNKFEQLMKDIKAKIRCAAEICNIAVSNVKMLEISIFGTGWCSEKLCINRGYFIRIINNYTLGGRKSCTTTENEENGAPELLLPTFFMLVVDLGLLRACFFNSFINIHSYFKLCRTNIFISYSFYIHSLFHRSFIFRFAASCSYFRACCSSTCSCCFTATPK